MAKDDKIFYNRIRYENDSKNVFVEKYINGKFDSVYKVNADSCTCPGFIHRGTCKHIAAFDEKVGDLLKPLTLNDARKVIGDAYLKLRTLYKYVEFMGYEYIVPGKTDGIGGLFFECDKPFPSFPLIRNFECNGLSVLINSPSYFDAANQ